MAARVSFTDRDWQSPARGGRNHLGSMFPSHLVPRGVYLKSSDNAGRAKRVMEFPGYCSRVKDHVVSSITLCL
jgi:hypothetical protein